ncbi:MAG: hypothetical protein IJ228_04600 [Succinivibrio sp.]|nr:hypothetical protein [Succinivibrio sp.]
MIYNLSYYLSDPECEKQLLDIIKSCPDFIQYGGSCYLIDSGKGDLRRMVADAKLDYSRLGATDYVFLTGVTRESSFGVLSRPVIDWYSQHLASA